jgi:hypothetical protein
MPEIKFIESHSFAGCHYSMKVGNKHYSLNSPEKNVYDEAIHILRTGYKT